MKYELDVKAFWEENAKCNIPFSTNKPRVPIHFWLDDHFIIEEMKIPSTLEYYNNEDYRIKVHKEFNDRVEKVLGRRFVGESKSYRLALNRFEVVMGSKLVLTEGGTPWLESTVESIDDVKKLIDRAQKLDMEKAVLPEGWEKEKERLEKETGREVQFGGGGSRGPATMATSILGTVNTCMFIMDYPEVMDDFFEILTDKLIEYNETMSKYTGHPINRTHFGIADDNCYLYPPKQYERFIVPSMQRLIKEYAPEPHHLRHQHSDSDMGHLMGILNDLGINAVNFGPNIHPLDIRKAMPKALIQGQMPPFLLRNGTPEEIINTVRRDIDTVGQDGGLVECTAGSVAAGTPLENILIYMWAVHTYGRYN